MKRHLITKLLAWKTSAQRKPLILMGVRQTGKTYLLTQFGKTYFKQLHIINFEKQTQLHALFDKDLDPQRILNDLRFQLNTNIDVQNDLIVFDEIQACPKALTSLKYFCEELPELALCSAGSLLGLHLNEGSYPVGKVDLLHLHPMTFSEFLLGINDEIAAEFIQEYNNNTMLSKIKHQRLWEKLKYYFITGGLPEVVKLFAEHQNNLFEATQITRQKQNELITAYYADIAKHSGKVNSMHIDRTWHTVPIQLASSHDASTKRFRFKGIVPNINRYQQLAHVIDWLKAAELVIKLPMVGAFEQPIAAYSKENLFKLFMFDIGLLGAMLAIDPHTIWQYDYGTYKGYFAENFVVQQLHATQMQALYSWEEERSEIEILLPYREKIVPIEVKAGKTVRAKSLEKYINKYQPTKSIILSDNLPRKTERIYHLPLYLAEKIDSVLRYTDRH